MRIAFLMYSFEDLATTSMSFWLSRELVKRGHEVTFVALSRKHRFRSETQVRDGVRVLLTPRGITGRFHYDGWGPHDILTRLLHLTSETYDVLVTADCRANVYLPFRIMKRNGMLRIALWYDRWGDGGLASGASRFGFQQRLEAGWEKALVQKAAGVITTSRMLLDLGKEWGVPDSRIRCIPHGSPVDMIQVVPRKEARRRTGLEAGGPVIGYMGHTLEQIPAFFPSFKQVIHRHPNTVFLCLGSCVTERSKVERAGLGRHFHFTGFVPADELQDWLACADLFLIPVVQGSVNDYYRYPGKLGEYAAAGRPIVAPDVGETGRLIKEEGIGVVACADLADLGDRICELIEDPELADRLGMRARRLAEERLAWPVLADRFEEFIEQVSKDRKGW
ncbi:MAG: glycosyltransferase family 4 protein [Candidatus Eisenbacteria bacterium]